MRRFSTPGVLIGLLISGCAVAFLYPEMNPDLFWHLAAAREAARQGVWRIASETFSFTMPGAEWINFEWLFDLLAYRLYQWGDFRLLVLTRVFLASALLALFDRHVSHILEESGIGGRRAGVLRGLNLAVVFSFLFPRTTMQPELFSLLFLVVFFHLRDRFIFLSRNPTSNTRYSLLLIPCCFLLFTIWANIHGGFIWALGVIGLQGVSRLFLLANAAYHGRRHEDPRLWREFSVQWKREAAGLAVMGLACFAGTLLNTFGWRIYEVIFRHLGDSGFIAALIQEWQPTQLYHRGGWAYFGLLAGAAALIIARKDRYLDFEAALLTLAFGWFASTHVRNTALFALVILPVFWRLAAPELKGAARARGGGEGKVRLALLGLLTVGGIWGGFNSAKQSFLTGRNLLRMGGVPASYVSLGRYPFFACRFIQSRPELAALNIFTEWGWGGYAVWTLAPRGARIFYDGRYLFHELLRELTRKSDDPKGWINSIRFRGTQVLVIQHPVEEAFRSQNVDLGRDGSAPILRSWHALALDPSQWAQVWWDNAAMVFVRRDAVAGAWLKTREYKTRVNVDPFWVHALVQTGKLRREEVLAEINRNAAETGWNERNLSLFRAASAWKGKNE